MELQGGFAVDEELAALAPWFHNLHLPDGRETAPDHPLGDFPRCLWRTIEASLPSDLSGWRALDIGCNAGFYSIELAARGAEVLALDVDPHYLEQARWAVGRFGVQDRVRLERAHVHELLYRDERFDLVLFLGVFYHLRHPLLGLEAAARAAQRLLVFQSLDLPEEEVREPPENVPFDQRARLGAPGWPRMAFVERRLASDPTNWWVPNRSAIEALLRSCGLAIGSRSPGGIYLCTPAVDEDPIQRRLREEELAALRGPRR
jgi:tRNA (mo5U34)-methyltransferase